jgi:hypothetical protein
MLRLNPDIRLQDIPLKNPVNLTVEELHQIREQIYAIAPEELLKSEGRKIARYLTRISAELARTLMI